MRVLKIYKNGRRVTGDSLAFISPYPEHEITREIDVSHLSDKDFALMQANPGRYDIAKKEVK